MIKEINDEYGMIEDITIESTSIAESVGSGDIDATVVEMDTSGHNTKRHRMGGPYDHVDLDHNSSP